MRGLGSVCLRSSLAHAAALGLVACAPAAGGSSGSGGTDGTGDVSSSSSSGTGAGSTGGLAESFSIGGTVVGLQGTVVLQNNGGDDVFVDSSGSFVFPTRIEAGGTYQVTVWEPPTNQVCEVNKGSGTATADVTDVEVICAEAPGSGVFLDSGQRLGDGDTHRVIAGDVDGDGDQDLVVANRGPNRVWLNDGRGGFADSGQEFGEDAILVALGDLDGDGDLDLVESGTIGVPVRVRLNDGVGGFSDSGQVLGGHWSNLLRTADVDGDGDRDVLEGRSTSPSAIWNNDGQGIFVDSGQELPSDGTNQVPRGAAFGDLDADGDLDLVLGNSGDPSKVWVNDGAGVFTDSGQELSDGQSRDVMLGDIDGDGDLDLVELNHEGQDSLTYINDGAGALMPTKLLLKGEPSVDGELGDLDGDGDLDLVVGTGNGVASKVLFGDGTGGYTVSGQRLPGSGSIALADLDGDTDLDLVLARAGSPGDDRGNLIFFNVPG